MKANADIEVRRERVRKINAENLEKFLAKETVKHEAWLKEHPDALKTLRALGRHS